ncbi:MAG TPA: ArsA-related P-loop ATPase [Microthrixaceae bacterium]|nr:ArsA-related P-loop ATPase [Microthrixaceae bacterium]
MDPAQFLTAPRVTIVAGKGGVGKTTVSAALAFAATRLGLSALIVEVEGKSGLPGLFGIDRLAYDELVLVPADPALGHGELRARTLTPDEALVEYLQDHGLRRVSNRLASSGAMDMVATATPGIKDVLILGKVKQLERAGAADVIVIDAPAAGHAISFLRSARGLLDAVKVGPIEAQARDVMELLGDPSRCEVQLVTLPEETPVNELVETAFSLEDQVGVSLAPVVVNGLYPELPGIAEDPELAAADAGVSLRPGEADTMRAAARFRSRRAELQVAQLERLGRELPLPQLRLPFLFTSDLGRPHLELLAEELLVQIAALAPAAGS